MYLIRIIIPKLKPIQMEQHKSWRGICVEVEHCQECLMEEFVLR